MTSTTTTSRRTVAGQDVPQYSRRRVLAVWAGAAVPMGVLSWAVAPAVAGHLDGPLPLARALVACLAAGLVWQFVLLAALVAGERRRGQVRSVRDALWLRPPTDPATGRPAPRAWWWLVPLATGFALVQFLPSPPVPATRDLGSLLGSASGQQFFHGNWPWFTAVVVLALFNTVLGEELLFRGFLLPRMREAFGRGDWAANGALFALYHLHQPWSMPSALCDAVLLAWPSRRWSSAWFGIIVHSTQSIFFVGLTLAVVLSHG